MPPSDAFEADVFPSIGDMAAADIRKAHIQDILDTMRERATDDKPMVRARKAVLGDMRQMFHWALERDYVEFDPTAIISKGKLGKNVERDRYLTESELIDLFQKLPSSGMADTSRLALLVQLSLIQLVAICGGRTAPIEMEKRMIRVSTNQLKSILKKMGSKIVDDFSTIERLDLEFDFTCSGSMKVVKCPINFIRLLGDEWEVKFPQKRPQKAGGTAAKLSVDIRKISENAKGFVVQHESIETWNELVNDLQALTENMETVDEIEYSDITRRAIMGYGYNVHLFAPLVATAYSFEGIKALERGDLIEATHCAERGAFWSSPERMNIRSKEILSERAKTGGIGKASRYESIKDIVTDLFVTLKPKEGWSKTHAIETVAVEMRKHYLSQLETSGLKDDNFTTTVAQWLRRDPKRFKV